MSNAALHTDFLHSVRRFNLRIFSIRENQIGHCIFFPWLFQWPSGAPAAWPDPTWLQGDSDSPLLHPPTSLRVRNGLWRHVKCIYLLQAYHDRSASVGKRKGRPSLESWHSARWEWRWIRWCECWRRTSSTEWKVFLHYLLPSIRQPLLYLSIGAVSTVYQSKLFMSAWDAEKVLISSIANPSICCF